MAGRVAAALLVVIGLSGLFVGLELLVAGYARSGDPAPAAIAIPAAIGAYGVAAVAAGIGLYVRRRWAYPLALVTIAVGLAELGWQTTLLGLDPVTLVGLALWAFVLVLLLVSRLRRPA